MIDLNSIRTTMTGNERLFVINTSSRNYRSISFMREREILEQFFPKKTEYEFDMKKIKSKSITPNDNKLIK